MTTRTITTTQLRGMIKEALEESVQEIAVDEQIAALKAKGGRRSLQETKQYRKLLEFKMGGLTELSALRDEEGVNPELLGLPLTGSGRQERKALEGEEVTQEELEGLRKDVEMVLAAFDSSRLVLNRMKKIDSDLEKRMLLSAVALRLGGSESEANDLLMKARTYLRGHVEEVPSDNRQLSLPGIGESRRLRRR